MALEQIRGGVCPTKPQKENPLEFFLSLDAERKSFMPDATNLLDPALSEMFEKARTWATPAILLKRAENAHKIARSIMQSINQIGRLESPTESVRLPFDPRCTHGQRFGPKQEGGA